MESLMKILKEEHLSCIVSQNNHIYKEKADGKGNALREPF